MRSYNRRCVRRGKEKGAYPAVTYLPTAAHDGPKGYATIRGFTVRGSSCPSDRKQSSRRAPQGAIEMSRGESLDQAIADESRSALDAYVCEGARQMLQRALECEVDAFLVEYADRADKRGRPRRRRATFTRSGSPRQGMRQSKPSITSWKSTVQSMRRRAPASRRTGMPSPPSTTLPPSTGVTSGRPTRSRAPLRRSACGIAARKAAAQGRPVLR